jgi:hypothetical protein
MVGINNELDALFSKCISNVIAMYYYDIDSNITLQLHRYQSIKRDIVEAKQIESYHDYIDDDYSAQSSFRNNNCILTTIEHMLVIRSYQTTRIEVPLFVQQSGFFRDGIFPKMGIGPEAEMVYWMVTTGDLNVLTRFKNIRGYEAEPIIKYKWTVPIRWENSDHVGLLDTYDSGDIEFLKYVTSFYAYRFGENIRVSIEDCIVVVEDMYNNVLYTDSSVNPVNVFNYTPPDQFSDWEDYDGCDIGDWGEYDNVSDDEYYGDYYTLNDDSFN